jgi:hypothetical protein
MNSRKACGDDVTWEFYGIVWGFGWRLVEWIVVGGFYGSLEVFLEFYWILIGFLGMS